MHILGVRVRALTTVTIRNAAAAERFLWFLPDSGVSFRSSQRFWGDDETSPSSFCTARDRLLRLCLLEPRGLLCQLLPALLR